MKTFGTAHRGHHIQLLDNDGVTWQPTRTLMEEPRPCPHGCCRVAYTFTGVGGRPELVHAAADTPITVLTVPGGGA